MGNFVSNAGKDRRQLNLQFGGAYAVGYDFDGNWDKQPDAVLIDIFLAIFAGKTQVEADT